jgi:hypothetical protein
VSVLEDVRAAVAGLLGRIGLDGSEAALGIVIFIVSFVGSIALTGVVLVRLPPDYLTSDSPAARKPLTLRARALRIGRHVLGVLLILLGILLSFPGVPGQGVLTIVAGLFISELPGTRALLRRILRSKKILSAVNKLRARYKHPPLEEPPSDAAR